MFNWQGQLPEIICWVLIRRWEMNPAPTMKIMSTTSAYVFSPIAVTISSQTPLSSLSLCHLAHLAYRIFPMHAHNCPLEPSCNLTHTPYSSLRTKESDISLKPTRIQGGKRNGSKWRTKGRLAGLVGRAYHS